MAGMETTPHLVGNGVHVMHVLLLLLLLIVRVHLHKYCVF